MTELHEKDQALIERCGCGYRHGEHFWTYETLDEKELAELLKAARQEGREELLRPSAAMVGAAWRELGRDDVDTMTVQRMLIAAAGA